MRAGVVPTGGPIRRSLLSLLALAALFALGCVAPPPGAEVCGDGQDNDRDGLSDCADPDCAGEPSCQPEDCQNGVDDNGDGAVDCGDAQCAAVAGCAGQSCEAAPLLDPGTTAGENSSSTDFLRGSCEKAPGPDFVFRYLPNASGRLLVTLSPEAADMALFVQSVCGAPGTELACSDAAGPAGDELISVPDRQGQPVTIVASTVDGSAGAPFGLTLVQQLVMP